MRRMEVSLGVSGWVAAGKKETEEEKGGRKQKVEKQPDAERKDRDEHRWRLERGRRSVIMQLSVV